MVEIKKAVKKKYSKNNYKKYSINILDLELKIFFSNNSINVYLKKNCEILKKNFQRSPCQYFYINKNSPPNQ